MRTDVGNLLALLLAIGLGIAGASWVLPMVPVGGGASTLARGAKGAPGMLRDARGVAVPSGGYRRIVSLHPVADQLLLRLVEPDRLVGITAHTGRQYPESWRYGDRALLGTSREIEPVLRLHPDLVIASRFSDEAYMARLREAGVVVFDLGDPRGIASTTENIEQLGLLLEIPDRAARLLASYQRDLAFLATQVRPGDRPSGIFLTNVGGTWFGGTRGSSYGDLIGLAGLRDVAAERGYRDWPQYTPEEILLMEPVWVVTRHGIADVICDDLVLREIPACRRPERVIELLPGYDSDPGLGLIEAAAQLQKRLRERTPPGPVSR